MSNFDANPYSPLKNTETLEPHAVGIRPIELLRRAKALAGEQYWTIVGLSFVALLVASFIPMALGVGPMMIGMFRCFEKREKGGLADFNDVFSGFDQFLEGLLVMLMMFVVNIVLLIPILGVGFFVILMPVLEQAQGGPPTDAQVTSMIAMFLLFYPALLLASIAAYLPFVFAFQLIADKKLTAWEAVTQSFQAVMKNPMGIIWMMLVYTVLNMFAAIACYVPLFLLMPLIYGAIHILYRDVFGTSVALEGGGEWHDDPNKPNYFS